MRRRSQTSKRIKTISALQSSLTSSLLPFQTNPLDRTSWLAWNVLIGLWTWTRQSTFAKLVLLLKMCLWCIGLPTPPISSQRMVKRSWVQWEKVSWPRRQHGWKRRQWSHDWLSLLLDNRQTPPRAIKISGLGIFDGKKFSREEKAEMPFSGRICSLPDIPGDSSAPGLPSMPAHMQAEKPVVKVKRELPDRSRTRCFNCLDSTLSKGTIELDTPSPNPKRPKTVNAELDVHDQFPDFGGYLLSYYTWQLRPKFWHNLDRARGLANKNMFINKTSCL